MFALLSTARKAILSVFALGALAWIASCTPTTVSGPTINTSAPVQVALLVPIGTGDATDGFLASNLENAARMAINPAFTLRHLHDLWQRAFKLA